VHCNKNHPQTLAELPIFRLPLSLPVLLIRIRNPYEMERKKIQSQDPGSGMNIPDLLFENSINFLG
jgi:hypothetical protein